MNQKNSKNEESKKLEEGMECSRKNKSLYLIIVTIIFIFANLAAQTPLTGIPVFFYKHRYLCKKSPSSNNFNVVCKRAFVCSNTNKLGIDYILDPKYDIRFNSFITSYDIYCSGTKRIILASSFFLGQLIGTIIYPFIVSFLGIIKSISISYFTIFVSYLIIAKFNYYIIGLIFYIISSMSYLICILGVKQYIVEMSDPKQRPVYVLFNLLSQIFSGFFVDYISFVTLDYRYVLFFSSLISIIGVILVNLFVVESIRILYIQRKIDKLMDNLEYISKVNNSKEYFDEWKNNNKNIFYNNNNYLDKNDEKLIPLLDKGNSNNEDEEKNDNKIGYITIWKYPSQVKLIILFSFATFYLNYSFVLAQLEIVKQKRFFFSLLEGYSCDMIGYIFGIMITKLENYTRKSCFLFLTVLLCIMYLIGGIFYSWHNQYIFSFFRTFVNSLDANFNLYNFESFPTLSRSTGVSINRIFGKFFNLFTPLIMINFAKLGYLCGLIFGVGLFFLSFFLSPKESKDHKINEYPSEMISECEKEETDEKDEINGDEEYKLKKN